MANTYLQTLLGESYHEGMTEDEIAVAIEALNLGKPEITPAPKSDDEVKRLKDLLSKANSEAADYKKQLRNKMTEAEQREADEKEAREKLLQQNQELTKKIAISENSTQLLALGYDAELAVKTAEAMYSGDLSTVFANQKAFIEKREADLKAELMRGTPKPPTGNNSAGGMTLEKLRAMSVADRFQFQQTHPEEYKQLYEADKEN